MIIQANSCHKYIICITWCVVAAASCCAATQGRSAQRSYAVNQSINQERRVCVPVFNSKPNYVLYVTSNVRLCGARGLWLRVTCRQGCWDCRRQPPHPTPPFDCLAVPNSSLCQDRETLHHHAIEVGPNEVRLCQLSSPASQTAHAPTRNLGLHGSQTLKAFRSYILRLPQLSTRHKERRSANEWLCTAVWRVLNTGESVQIDIRSW